MSGGRRRCGVGRFHVALVLAGRVPAHPTHDPRPTPPGCRSPRPSVHPSAQETAIEQDGTPFRDPGPRLGIWHLVLPAAPNPCLFRRDRPFDPAAPATDVADVLRYVAVARRVLKGPLALEIEGPGDPLASPETVLRALALLADHHPDVVTGLVVDGPLLPEYVEEFLAFGLGYLVVRRDAATFATARRLVAGARFRGDDIDRDEAAALMLHEGERALCLAARVGIAAAARITLIPTVNAREIGTIARRAFAAGARRVDVRPHQPSRSAPLARASGPTADELLRARALVRRVANEASANAPATSPLEWMCPERLQPVNLDVLDALDVLRQVPDAPTGVVAPPILPPRRALLVAVATSDGTMVDTPLHAASVLRIYAVTEETIRCVGARPLPLDPRRRHDGVGDAPAFLAALVGVRALVATSLPARAVTLLGAVGIRAVPHGGPLEEILDRVARGTVIRAEA